MCCAAGIGRASQLLGKIDVEPLPYGITPIVDWTGGLQHQLCLGRLTAGTATLDIVQQTVQH